MSQIILLICQLFTEMQQNQTYMHRHTHTHTQMHAHTHTEFNFNNLFPHLISMSQLQSVGTPFNLAQTSQSFKFYLSLYLKSILMGLEVSSIARNTHFSNSRLPFQIPGHVALSACQATKQPSQHLCISSLLIFFKRHLD